MKGHLSAVAVGSAHTELSAKIRLMARFFEQGALWGKHLDAKRVWGDTAGVLREASEAELVRT